MKRDRDIAQEWRDTEEAWWSRLETLLRGHDYAPAIILQRAVAWICDVSPIDMLTVCDKIYMAQTRWLFWYAYRYMTHDTYERISEKTQFDGHKFGLRSVAKGIEKMATMVETEEIWRRRWLTLKGIIKIIKNEINEEQIQKITLNVPSNVEVEIKKEKEI